MTSFQGGLGRQQTKRRNERLEEGWSRTPFAEHLLCPNLAAAFIERLPAAALGLPVPLHLAWLSSRGCGFYPEKKLGSEAVGMCPWAHSKVWQSYALTLVPRSASPSEVEESCPVASVCLLGPQGLF